MRSRENSNGTMRIVVCVVVSAMLFTGLTGSILHWIPTLAALAVGAMVLRSMTEGNKRR